MFAENINNLAPRYVAATHAIGLLVISYFKTSMLMLNVHIALKPGWIVPGVPYISPRSDGSLIQ